MSDGIVAVVDMAGAEDEALVLRERHACVLRVRRGRTERAAPAHQSGGDPGPAPVGQFTRGRDQLLMPRRRRSRQRPCVALRPDGGDRVERVDLGFCGGRDEGQLVVTALIQQDLGRSFDVNVQVRERAGPKSRAVELGREWQARGRRVDAKRLAGLQIERVAGQEAGQPLETRVGHRPTRKGLLTTWVDRTGFIDDLMRIAKTYRPRLSCCRGKRTTRFFALITPLTLRSGFGRPLVSALAIVRLGVPALKIPARNVACSRAPATKLQL